MSVQRTFALLEYLARNGSAGLRRLARDLDVPVGTTHRLVASLAEEDLVERTPHGEWQLTYRLVGIAGAQLAQSGLPAQARPVLQELAAASGQTAFLATNSGNDVVYLDKVQSHAQVQLYIELGARRPIHATALGKAILAHLPEVSREEILNQPLRALTEHTITEPALLRHQLDQVRARGYATDKEEVVSGISCLAAPIFDHTQSVVGALSVAGTDARLHAEDPELVQRVLAGATTVSLRLGLAPE
jgi:IclR family acetate operon transcriptional repressor